MGVICLPANRHMLSESHLASWGLDTAWIITGVVMWWSGGNWHVPIGGGLVGSSWRGCALRSPVAPEERLARFGFAPACCVDLVGLAWPAKDTSLGVFDLYIWLRLFDMLLDLMKRGFSGFALC